ncbi:hypothetical protein QYM36_019236 [Artemia franciscana]|uniref:Uncharacterized protein n=1 Tax=Artemia franciscana TaxID=6661 RepID=A0AA88HB31_ARTSF|nr:hypothetical protein QYM36_019236 [Artemia franciscana]
MQKTKGLVKNLQQREKELSDANRRIRYIETEAKRTNVIIYTLGQRDPPLPTLKEEVMLYLNTRISSLEFHRSEVKDVYRRRSGAILRKLQCADTRNFILKSGRTFRSDGVSVAPNYTLEERNARNHLKIVMNQEIEEEKPLRLRRTKLFVDGTLLVYDEEKIYKMEERLLDRKVQEELKVLREGKLPVEQLIDGLNGIIHEITPKVSPESKRKEFFDDECLARKKELLQIVEKVKALIESPLKVTVVLQMKAMRRDYKRLLKHKKEKRKK